MEHAPKSRAEPFHVEHPAREVLSRGLAALGRPATAAEIERWERLAELLAHWGQRINLTGHRGPRAIAERLLLEAAALSGVLPAADRIVDLGSGAGIPGLPLAICRPEAEIWLVESRERRHHFQRAAIRELGLANVRTLRGRVEALEPIPCGGVISQAFAKPHQALAWMRPWLAESGWIALAATPSRDVPFVHPDLTPGELLPYAAPGAPPREVWLARLRGGVQTIS